MHARGSARKGNQLWQPSCRIVGDEGERKYELWQPSC